MFSAMVTSDWLFGATASIFGIIVAKVTIGLPCFGVVFAMFSCHSRDSIKNKKNKRCYLLSISMVPESRFRTYSS